MSQSFKDQISNDIQKAKEEGKLRSDRLREIVKLAVSSAASELREGSGEIRSLVKDAVSTVVDALKDRGSEAREEITASIEGAIEGISAGRRQAIAKSEVEMQKLQSQIESQEQELQDEIDGALKDIETNSNGASDNIKAAIRSALNNVQDTEEVALLRKRYAQLQAQIAVVKANLTARYGERYDDTKKYLDDARTWYAEAMKRAESETDTNKTRLQEKQVEFESKMSQAGTALARKERQVRQLLKDLWHTVSDV
ncbi:histidine kinase [Oscillatoria sp. FACHB-1407]|uniref:histidine kinase n=1 Tax=Oscillatoria sp. FACHB-1407 TaxID=2692847 RepID=UPI001687079D|nr:histidine kinase [Oscillatoria sp. FACHB-1407]MBD2464638.1 histidine kinase [Oscillatoria sp. FACHB-1407]